MRRLPVPATEYCSFVPLTLQFVTATANSLRAKLPLCRSAAQVQRIFRTHVAGTSEPVVSRNAEKSSCTLHCSGDTPPVKLAAAGAVEGTTRFLGVARYDGRAGAGHV